MHTNESEKPKSMKNPVTLNPLDRYGLEWAQGIVTLWHYLRRPVDPRCSVEGYSIHLPGPGCVGLFLLGRPEATRCYPWYGSVPDIASGRAEVTRWQVINLARVWLNPNVQPGGEYYDPEILPGFADRKGVWHSMLASAAIEKLVQRAGVDYLVRRPPCFLDEPYEIRWMLSYCDTRLHRGTIYRAAGFDRFRVNENGIETWRIRLPGMTAEQDTAVRDLTKIHPRSLRYQAARAQLRFDLP